VIPVKGASKRVARDPGQRLAKLIEQHERNEAKLRRAMRAWDKSLLTLRRAERRLDKLVLTPEAPEADDFNDSF
jgi:septal ring factor EnvC (AmiA/AmiB activator)